jgi:hypothetical protein
MFEQSGWHALNRVERSAAHFEKPNLLGRGIESAPRFTLPNAARRNA